MPDEPSRDLGKPHYDLTTILLHWITVGFIVVLWAIGQTADLLPRGSFRSGLWSIHVLVGLATACVLLTRVAWRASFGLVAPPADQGVLYVLAKTTHYALYALLAVVVALGIGDALYRHFNLFGIWQLPQIGAGDAATRHSINEWHGLAANLLIIVAGFHALAALTHHYVWRDRLLNRMAP